MRIPGIVLAAGASRRMGRPKPLLELGGRSFVDIAVTLLREGGVGPVVTVTRAELALEVASWLEERSRVVVNPRPEDGMLSSLRVGLDALEAWGREQAGHEEEGPWPGFALLLVDQPRVPAAAVRMLAEIFSRHPDRIVLPSLGPGGRGGHPVFFPWGCVPELRSASLEEGPRGVVRRDPGRVLRIEVPYGACFEDVDTPEDFRQIQSGMPQDPMIEGGASPHGMPSPATGSGMVQRDLA